MNYEEAVSYIEDIPKFTKKHPLEHTKEFLTWLGNPGMNRKILHVAGTNGKGSVCAYMQAILMAEGKHVGFFTSPHLISINERIRIDNRQLDNDAFLQVFLYVKKVVDKMVSSGLEHPTYFEFLFGMAMTSFENAGLEFIILETGIGGRLDATNSVAQPLLTVITSISLDHTEILGDTTAQIAYEKAGIIKSGVPLFCGVEELEPLSVIRKQAQIKGADCREISKNAFEIREITDKHIAFCRVNAYDEDVTWTLANTGVYQIMNALLAITAMEYVFPADKRHYKNWQETLASIKWEGRMEEVAPGVIIDGAHNLGAIEAFIESVEASGYQKDAALPVILFSAVSDKDYEKMICVLCGKLQAKAYIVTQIEDKRGVPAKVLGDIFRKYTDREVVEAADYREAWTLALDSKEKGGKLYCLGSLYLAGMIKRQLDRR